MTVKELKENLKYFDDDDEIELTFVQEVEVDSWKENIFGYKYVEINKKLDICFIGGTNGNCWIDLEVKE